MDERQPAEDIAAMGAPASPDALKEIVARHHRRRSRTLGVLLAVALVAGPVAGWAIGQGGGGGQQVATGSYGGTPTAANAPASGGGVSGAMIASPAESGAKATHLFTRTTSGGIAIRAYRMDPPTPPPSTPSTTTGKAQTICPKPMIVKPGAPAGAGEGGGVSSGGAETKPAPSNTVVNGAPPPPCAPSEPPMCKAAPSVLAEVSNDAAVGQSFDPIDEKQPTDALSHLVVGALGGIEGSPVSFVTVQTSASVAKVRLRTPGGATDEMAPSGGVAVLAIGVTQPPPDGTVVEALDGGGNVLQSLPVNQPGPKMGFACGIMAGPVQPAVRTYQAPPPAAPPTTR